MKPHKTILLKLTGSLIKQTANGLDASPLLSIARQIKQLQDSVTFGVVIGGSNFFNGTIQSPQVNIATQTGHTVGMIATLMNGLIAQDIFEQEGINTVLFSAFECSLVGIPVSPQAIREAQKNNICMIFAGGTGNPYFSTDTTAIVRALQINAQHVWKGTKVEGIYSDDPHKNPAARLLSRVSFKEALENNLGIMDSAAFSLAANNNLTIRIVNIFAENALIRTNDDPNFGSTLSVS